MDGLEAQVEKLTPQPGDILVVRIQPDKDGVSRVLDHYQRKQVCESVKRSVRADVDVLVADGRFDYELLRPKPITEDVRQTLQRRYAEAVAVLHDDGREAIGTCEVCGCKLYEDSDYHHDSEGIRWCAEHDKATHVNDADFVAKMERQSEAAKTWRDRPPLT